MKIPKKLAAKIRLQAKNRCGYCLSSQTLVGVKFEIDHILSIFAGGKTEEENLWLACRQCNNNKGKQIARLDEQTGKVVKLFNPRRQHWKRHFRWSNDGIFIIGKTACGRATIKALKLNDKILTDVREAWISVGWHPPKD